MKKYIFLFIPGVLYLLLIALTWFSIDKLSLGDNQKIYECTRINRYSNPPEVNKSLDIIQERFSTFNKFIVKQIPCIKVYYSDIESEGLEGYFVFNELLPTNNFLPIHLNQRYKGESYLVLSPLLVHEIVHTVQYYDMLNAERDLDCFAREVEAFRMAGYLFALYSDNEMDYVVSRIKLDSSRIATNTMEIVSKLSENIKLCGVKNWECWSNRYNQQIEKAVKNQYHDICSKEINYLMHLEGIV